MGESDRFLVRHWLDGSVVFDRQFGDTHALDPAASAIFFALENGERGKSTLIAKISQFYPESPAQDIPSRVNELLEHLERLGLVRADIN